VAFKALGAAGAAGGTWARTFTGSSILSKKRSMDTVNMVLFFMVLPVSPRHFRTTGLRRHYHSGTTFAVQEYVVLRKVARGGP